MNTQPNDFAFLPLGGTGEIGMNFNLYRCDGTYLAVDCGIGFGGSDNPEVDVMVPDVAFIAERRKQLAGLVITHAHEDHIGGVAWLWPKLLCPVYCTPFAAAVLRRKLTEAGLLGRVKVHIIEPGGTFAIGPFGLSFIPVAHSIPEAQALAIRTHYGTVVHTGDWKIDPEPMVGPPTDEAAFRALGDAGVLALVCDSTNAMQEGHSGSEATVRKSLSALIADLRGRVAVTCFASNVARMESVAMAARDAGRSVALVGRSLRNFDAAARESGYLRDVPSFLSDEDAEDVPDDHLLMLISGSQGEDRSALTRISQDTHRSIALGEGDTVIYSSRMIPGNERAIEAVQDSLTRRGVRVITDADHLVHVSGHPARDELRQMYQWTRPQYAVPVHGEWRHLSAHAALAREFQARPILMEDGDLLNLAPGTVEITDSAPVGRLVVDGTRLVSLTGGVMSARRKMLFNGVAVVSIAVDADGVLLSDPRVTAPGLFEANDAEMAKIEDEIADHLEDLTPAVLKDDAALQDAARAALRRALGKRVQKKPHVDVHLLRV